MYADDITICTLTRNRAAYPKVKALAQLINTHNGTEICHVPNDNDPAIKNAPGKICFITQYRYFCQEKLGRLKKNEEFQRLVEHIGLMNDLPNQLSQIFGVPVQTSDVPSAVHSTYEITLPQGDAVKRAARNLAATVNKALSAENACYVLERSDNICFGIPFDRLSKDPKASIAALKGAEQEIRKNVQTVLSSTIDIARRQIDAIRAAFDGNPHTGRILLQEVAAYTAKAARELGGIGRD